MDEEGVKMLESLVSAPGPAGYERPVQDCVRRIAGDFAQVETDWHGNVTCSVNESGPVRVMLAGHCDQIGLIVNHIDDTGFLWVGTIGGWDIPQLIGQALQVWTAEGPIPAVVARKAVHLLSTEDRNRVPKIKELFVDIGAKDADEARQWVRIGDPVTLRLGMTTMRNELAYAPAMDDRVGVWVVLNAARRAAGRGGQAAVHAVSTVQEEIGLRGARTSAFAIDPHVAIAVDVTHATDTPDVDPNEHGRIKLGEGPVVFRGPNVNPVLFERLMKVAADGEIPIQIAALARGAGNDANVMQLTRRGPATAIVAIPNRYMHSAVEVISLRDLDNAAELLARFCCDLDESADFTP